MERKMNCKYLLIGILLVIEVFSIYMCVKSFNNKNNILDTAKLQYEIKESNSMFAVLVDTLNRGYIPYESDGFPGIGYTYNEDRSGCNDIEGNKIIDALAYSEGIATVKTNETALCYLYFELEETTALESDVLEGKTYYDNDGNLRTGTLITSSPLTIQSVLQEGSISVENGSHYVMTIIGRVDSTNLAIPITDIITGAEVITWERNTNDYNIVAGWYACVYTVIVKATSDTISLNWTTYNDSNIQDYSKYIYAVKI